MGSIRKMMRAPKPAWEKLTTPPLISRTQQLRNLEAKRKTLAPVTEGPLPPDPALKGIRGGNCNREACQMPHAWYFNHSTHKYYCASCADKINRMNPESIQLFGHDLCTLNKPNTPQSKLD